MRLGSAVDGPADEKAVRDDRARPSRTAPRSPGRCTPSAPAASATSTRSLTTSRARVPAMAMSDVPCQRQQRSILEPALAHLNHVDTRTRRGCRGAASAAHDACRHSVTCRSRGRPPAVGHHHQDRPRAARHRARRRYGCARGGSWLGRLRLESMPDSSARPATTVIAPTPETAPRANGLASTCWSEGIV